MPRQELVPKVVLLHVPEAPGRLNVFRGRLRDQRLRHPRLTKSGRTKTDEARTAKRPKNTPSGPRKAGKSSKSAQSGHSGHSGALPAFLPVLPPPYPACTPPRYTTVLHTSWACTGGACVRAGLSGWSFWSTARSEAWSLWRTNIPEARLSPEAKETKDR